MIEKNILFPIRNTFGFIKERFPFKATVPLVSVFCAAPLSMTDFNLITAGVVFVSVFIGMLTLRMADDLASIEIDRITSPDRGLPSGRIDAVALKKSLILLVVLNLGLNYPAGTISAVLPVTFFYGIYFLSKKHLPLLIRPFLSNLAFFGVPLYVSLAVTGKAGSTFYALGFFIYFSAVAHEFSHSVHGQNEGKRDIPSYSGLIGPRASALLSFAVFFIAFFSGALFWYFSGKPVIFIVLLAATTIQIVYLEFLLVKSPCARNAKKFYIHGFTFFLLPMIGLVADRYSSVVNSLLK